MDRQDRVCRDDSCYLHGWSNVMSEQLNRVAAILRVKGMIPKQKKIDQYWEVIMRDDRLTYNKVFMSIYQPSKKRW